jgi:hypothetical protein
VITGFNTDIKHGSRVFHVQTEDKGLENPFVESLVYVGGEIIASKKTPYADSIKSGGGSASVQEMMESQHRKMIAAVQRGRFDTSTGAPPKPLKDESFEAILPRVASSSSEIPAGAVVVERSSKTDEKTLDQVILDYLASEVSQEHLDLTLYSSPDFFLGENVEIRVKAETSLSRRPISGALILVKVISTVDKPLVVYQGKTTSDGSCIAHCKMPEYQNGNAALIIQATSDTGSNEIKYLLRHRR